MAEVFVESICDNKEGHETCKQPKLLASHGPSLLWVETSSVGLTMA